MNCKILVVDLDDTLLISEKKKCTCGATHYYNFKAIKKQVDALNTLYDKGYTVIIHTGRNWDKYQFTKDQLFMYGVKHHELIMGKPQGPYIDSTNNFTFPTEVKKIMEGNVE